MSSIDKWVAVELSSRGQENIEKIESLIQREISKSPEIFVPTISFEKNRDSISICLLEGYIFVEAGYPASFYFDLKRTPYIKKVFTKEGDTSDSIRYIDDEYIEDIREELRKESVENLEEGDTVRIKEGTYENLEGRISNISDGDGEKKVSVKITELDAMENLIIEIPQAFLEKI